MSSYRSLALGALTLLGVSTVHGEINAGAAKPKPGANVWQAEPAERARAAEAFGLLTKLYAAKGVKNTRKLYVVYFTPADREPYPDYRLRMDHVVRDVSHYYAREMVANGLPPLTFGYETDADGILKMHMAKGDRPLSGYDKEGNAGKESKAAADKVLREAGIDPDNNHVLIICQMPDGISPYYGGGSQKSGVCWICDLPGLDPANLASKLSKEDTFKLAKNAEELAIFRDRALGDHTTVYMGGTAHELGHCFYLPHTGDSPEQQAKWGKSLMGSGNYAYGQEFRGAGKGTFLNPTDALRLISQPLFSGYDYRVTDSGSAVFADLVATPEGNGFRVSGRIASANVPVYATLVTFNFAKAGGDYPSNAVSSLVDLKTGGFSAMISRDYNGPIDVMLTALHVNGERTILHTATTSQGRNTDTTRLNLEWAFAPVESLARGGKNAEALAATKKIAATHAGSEEFAARAAAWARLFSTPTQPGAAPSARKAGESSVSLADCAAVSEKSGYGPLPPSRDRIPGDGSPLPRIGDNVPARSLFTHAPGSYVFDLGGAWKKLTGTYGVQHGASGKIALTILGDGKELFQGPTISNENKETQGDYSVDVTGVKNLEFKVTAPEGMGSAWGVIGDPTLSR
ncbi:MAG: NPCBM/NEW2 domain-containing protein [Luteolibacter sp.]|uniref:NPCBM/NEW2 domain-containing protein n=1 Tax=Luteolibacter sp. TaxID=1962973 RepID=UPI003267E982